MKKATLTVLLALCLALLLTACGGEETISGRITEYLRGDAGVNGFLMERDGRTVGVRLDEKSGIYPDLVIITEKALRDAEYPGMGVTVTGEPAAEKLTAADGTEVPTYLASSVIIDSIPYGEPLTLEDGTRIAVRLNRYGPAYYAPDGMLLFQEDNQTPGDIFMDRVDFDIVSKEVQDKIYARYRELGEFYDAEYQVERAWAEYNELGRHRDFRMYIAHQTTGSSCYNDRVIFYSTNVVLSRNTRRTYEKYYHAIYDRETGETVSVWDLFRPDAGEMQEWLLLHFEPLDIDRRRIIAENFDPQWFYCGRDGFGMFLPWDCVPNDDGPYMYYLFFTDEELTGMLRDGVLPLKDTHPIPGAEEG